MKKYIYIGMYSLVFVSFLSVTFHLSGSYKMLRKEKEMSSFYRTKLVEKANNFANSNKEIRQEKIYWERRANSLYQKMQQLQSEIPASSKVLSDIRLEE